MRKQGDNHRICAAKRVFDTALALLASPLWLSLCGICAVLVLAFDGSPALFRQKRAGKGGRAFSILKFRTMRSGDGTDAERTTRLGAFLRRTSLDELPQLFNVLRGDMALVGPRPLPTSYLPLYSADQARRHDVRPGITGWAQVNGRNAVSWEEKFRFDVWYVDNVSPWLDFKILAMTVGSVLSGRGTLTDGGTTPEPFKGSAI